MDKDAYIRTLTVASDQVSTREVAVILRELERVIHTNVSGDIVEFGCYEGTTSVHLAKWIEGSGRTLYLYDSFEGLPDKTYHDESPAGMQFKTGELLASKKILLQRLRKANVSMPYIKKAWFSELNDTHIPRKIAFAFLDGDYYESVKIPLELIQSHLSPGAIIVVDDYANEALPGAAKATDEWVSRHKNATMRVEASLAIIRVR